MLIFKHVSQLNTGFGCGRSQIEIPEIPNHKSGDYCENSCLENFLDEGSSNLLHGVSELFFLGHGFNFFEWQLLPRFCFQRGPCLQNEFFAPGRLPFLVNSRGRWVYLVWVDFSVSDVLNQIVADIFFLFRGFFRKFEFRQLYCLWHEQNTKDAASRDAILDH